MCCHLFKIVSCHRQQDRPENLFLVTSHVWLTNTNAKICLLLPRYKFKQISCMQNIRYSPHSKVHQRHRFFYYLKLYKRIRKLSQTAIQHVKISQLVTNRPQVAPKLLVPICHQVCNNSLTTCHKLGISHFLQGCVNNSHTDMS